MARGDHLQGRHITFDEIKEKWLAEEDMSGGVELSLRTFHKWRIAAEELFGLCIECERKGGITTISGIRRNSAAAVSVAGCSTTSQ